MVYLPFYMSLLLWDHIFQQIFPVQTELSVREKTRISFKPNKDLNNYYRLERKNTTDTVYNAQYINV